MYCINGVSGSSLLTESTDSMIIYIEREREKVTIDVLRRLASLAINAVNCISVLRVTCPCCFVCVCAFCDSFLCFISWLISGSLSYLK